MNNQLIKTTKLTFVPGSPGYPAFPGQPWIPARTVAVPRTVMEPQYAAQRTFVAYTGISGNRADGTDYGNQSNVVEVWNANHTTLLGWWVYFGSTFTGYKPVTYYDYVYYPEQPYMPPVAGSPPIASQTIVDLNLGWNSSAGSVVHLERDGYFSFRIPSTTGIFIGFSADYLTTGYMDIAFGVHFARGIAQPYSYGSPVGAPFTYTLDQTFAVERFDGDMVVWAGTAEKYTMPAIEGPMYLVASIYAGGEFVYDPVMRTEDFSGAEVSFPALQSITSEDAYGQSAVSFQPLTSEARKYAGATADLPFLTSMSSNYTYADSRGLMPYLRSTAEGGMLVPGYATSSTMILPLLLASHGLTGETGGATASLQRFTSLSSDHAYGEARAVFQPLEIVCSAYEGAQEASMHSLVGVAGGWSAPTVAYLAWSETLGASVVFTTDRAVDQLYAEHLTVDGSWSLMHELGARLMTAVQAGFAAPLFDNAGNVWVVTPDGKTTRYESFDYTGYAKINGRQYGIKADGVYLLEGSDDAGAAIQAAIGLGKQAFGTSLQKSVVAAYLGVSSTSKMYLKIVANGKDYLYAARQDSENLKAQRVDPGKGLKATFMDFFIYNSDGADFALASVEFTAIPLGRRI